MTNRQAKILSFLMMSVLIGVSFISLLLKW